MELSPHVSSVRERVHFESSLEQKSFIRVRGATNPATRRNPVDYHASRVLNGTGEMESGTQAPQLRIGRWKQACCCSTGKLPVRVTSICNGRFRRSSNYATTIRFFTANWMRSAFVLKPRSCMMRYLRSEERRVGK